ncbi:hypothetical protein BDF21DRAFT_338035, partial [Thamnidium elegans]
SYLHTIQTIDSSQCRLCHQSVDHLNHFVLMCPKKLDIWQLILQNSDITSNISNEDILETILSLKVPSSIRKSQISSYYTIIATPQWVIWIYYW